MNRSRSRSRVAVYATRPSCPLCAEREAAIAQKLADAAFRESLHANKGPQHPRHASRLHARLPDVTCAGPRKTKMTYKIDSVMQSLLPRR